MLFNRLFFDSHQWALMNAYFFSISIIVFKRLFLDATRFSSAIVSS